jgi:hypothetical protein
MAGEVSATHDTGFRYGYRLQDVFKCVLEHYDGCTTVNPGEVPGAPATRFTFGDGSRLVIVGTNSDLEALAHDVWELNRVLRDIETEVFGDE